MTVFDVVRSSDSNLSSISNSVFIANNNPITHSAIKKEAVNGQNKIDYKTGEDGCGTDKKAERLHH